MHTSTGKLSLLNKQSQKCTQCHNLKNVHCVKKCEKVKKCFVFHLITNFYNFAPEMPMMLLCMSGLFILGKKLKSMQYKNV